MKIYPLNINKSIDKPPVGLYLIYSKLALGPTVHLECYNYYIYYATMATI